MDSRNFVFIVALTAVVVLAGCSGGLGGAGGDTEPSSEQLDVSSGGDTTGADGGGTGGRSAGASEDTGTKGSTADVADSRALQVRERVFIRTGTVRMEVEKFASARSKLVGVAQSRGGWVAESSVTNHRRANETWTTGRLVLRVPADSFQDALANVKRVGTVEDAEADRTDVTDRLVDLEARLKNLRAQRERLRTLYERANETEDVLRVAQRLSDVQGEIERLEAKKRSLEGRVSYSTITVTFGEPRPDPLTPTPEPAYHEVGLVTAFLSSVDGVVVAFETIVVTVAYVLPYVLAFGSPLLVVAGLAYATRRRGLW